MGGHFDTVAFAATAAVIVPHARESEEPVQNRTKKQIMDVPVRQIQESLSR